ncbi:hypothetical protein [Virgibacillus oceani]|uniref:Uncharacterized protein n=1 Tax=Virgibacillus oceani TaxID=1479511 RepID=A0A917HDP6_9BACI|nr:hypothetical protein [Virgibacillus oceani]GGG76033.1 hypothetical protein GCM10011398_21180 [Virgibacillus oceani]
MAFFFLAIVLIVYLFDFKKIQKQNNIMINQNERIIALLEQSVNKQNL